MLLWCGAGGVPAPRGRAPYDSCLAVERDGGRVLPWLLASLLPAYSLSRRALLLLATHHDEAGGLPVLVRGVRVRGV